MGKSEAAPTFVSLFSSAGIGDIGLKEAGFHCLASAELIPKRLEVQRLNEIAAPSDLICGDLNLDEVFDEVISRVRNHKQKYKKDLTLLVATPPCQGMSVANHKKNDEKTRNSLVVRSIEAIKLARPLTFVFENVPSFMNTICTGLDGQDRLIGDEIERTLSGDYEYYSEVLPLQNYGSPSSRRRSITIGVRNDIGWVTPLDLFPSEVPSMTLRELIGHLPSLTEMGSSADNDLLHTFRPYQERMVPWISGLEEGQSAFDNAEPERRPHRVVDGRMVPNVRKNGDKYRRVYWDSIAPCVHTRNDILASQNTVHPQDDRVFSIRELMKMMGLPDSFIWFAGQEEALMKRDIDTLKRHSSNIRQCLGEGVPTPVMRSIGENIGTHLVQHLRYLGSRPRKKENSSWTTHAQKAAYQELSDQKRKRLSAHYTEPLAAFAVLKDALGPFKGRKRAIKILEPSVGSGVFLHVLSGMVGGLRVQVTAVDLDPDAIKAVQSHADWFEKKFESIDLIEGDYIAKLDGVSYDLVIGNPPFGRTAINVGNKWGTHPEIAVRFLSKAIEQASRVAFVYPKTLLHGVGYRSMRLAMTETGSVESIHDFGELAFPNVKVETIGFIYDREHIAEMDTYLKSWTLNKSWIEKASYVLDPDFPSWTIYRNEDFDSLLDRCEPGRFKVWRDRSISRKHAADDGVRVIRGRNLGTAGQLVPDERDYFIAPGQALAPRRVLESLVGNSKFLAPNLSYFPRAVQLAEDCEDVPEGSCAVLYGDLSDQERERFVTFAASDEFRSFYRIACNFATRSINIDSCLAYWWMVPGEDFHSTST